MAITKDIFDILTQNEKVKAAFNKGVDALVDAVTGHAPSIDDRKAALLAMVSSLDSIAGTVSDYHAYYGALVGLCFETADVSGRGVLVEDLYAPPHFFYFPVPAPNSRLTRGTRKPFDTDVYGVVDQNGTFQSFYSPSRADAQPVTLAAVRAVREQAETDEAFLNSMNSSGYRMNALVGVSIVVQPPGYRYEPKSPNPFGDDVPLTIVRKAGQTRKRLQATLTQDLKATSI
jgi:hypothetical protein